jgi:hypothetical protein
MPASQWCPDFPLVDSNASVKQVATVAVPIAERDAKQSGRRRQRAVGSNDRERYRVPIVVPSPGGGHGVRNLVKRVAKMRVVVLGLAASFIAAWPRSGRCTANFKTGRRVSDPKHREQIGPDTGAGSRGYVPGWARGSTTLARHPFLSLRFRSSIEPPWASAICRERTKPMPLPAGLVV